MKISLNRKLILFDKGDMKIAFDPFNSRTGYVIFEDTAKEIINLIQREKQISVNKLIFALRKMYECNSKDIREDVVEFIRELSDIGYINTGLGVNERYIESKESIGELVEKNDNYEEIYKWHRERCMPFKVFVELTYACNLKCKHCYLGHNMDTGIMNVRDALRLLDELHSCGVVEVCFSGGEVRLHPNMFEIIEYAIYKGFVVELLTNATLFTEEEVHRLGRLGLKDVRISLYGLREEHDKFVEEDGAFDKSVNVLSILKKYKIGTAAIVVASENYKSFSSLISFLDEKEIDYEDTPLIFPKVDKSSNNHDIRLTEEQQRQYFKISKKQEKISICSAGISRFRISPDGTVNPCEMLRHIVFGNINKNSFATILNGEQRKKWIQSFNEIISSRKCTKCKRRSVCIECMGISFLETGSLVGIPRFFCDLSKTRLEMQK